MLEQDQNSQMPDQARPKSIILLGGPQNSCQQNLDDIPKVPL